MNSKKKLIILNFVLLAAVLAMILLLTKNIMHSSLQQKANPSSAPAAIEASKVTPLPPPLSIAHIPDSKNEESSLNEGTAQSSLKGKIICIDAGHQAKGDNHLEPIAPGSSEKKAKVSSGTKGTATGKFEFELNLEAALKLQEELQKREAIVYMTREKNDVSISNIERAELANQLKADLSLRIHADGSNNSSRSGFSLLIPGTKYVDAEIASESKKVAVCIEKVLSTHISNPSNGLITRNDLTGFNWCKRPMVLIEMGFMTNPEEDHRMSTETFQNDFAAAVAEGLETYFKHP